MKLSIKTGSTSQTINVFIQDSSSTTGAGLTGLVFNSGSLTAYYALPRSAAVSITLATLAAVTSTYSSGGFKEIDATNMPGWYRLDVPDAALASGRFTSIHLKGATNMAPCPIEIELTAWENQNATNGGMSALPAAAAEAAGGLYTRGSGAGQINQPANGQIDANTVKVSGTSQTARDLGASVLVSPGTGTGQIDLAAGLVNVGKVGGVTQTGRDLGSSVLISAGTGTGQLDVSSGAIKIQTVHKKNTALSAFEFNMWLAGTNTPATGKTVTVTRSIDGGAYAAGTLSTVTEIANGTYKCDFAAGDRNGNVVVLQATASGCDPTYERFQMEP